MGLDELLISTGVDALIKLIREKKKIELEEAAKILDVPFQAVEEWAQALEDEKLIKIEYQFTKVYLIWLKEAEGKILEKIGNVKTQKENLKQMINSIKRRLEKKSKEIDGTEEEYKKILNLFDPKLIEIQKKVKNMKNLEMNAEENLQQHYLKLEDLKIDLDTFSEHLTEKEKEWKTLYGQLKNPDNQINGLKELRGFELKLKNKTEDMLKNLVELEKQIESQKQSYSKFSSIEKQINSAGKEIEKIGKIAEQTKKQIDEITIKQRNLQKSLKNKSIEDSIKKLENVKGTIPEIKKQIEQINNEMGGQIKSLNELAKIYEEIQGKEGKIIFEVLEQRQKTFEKNVNELNTIVKNIKTAKKFKPEIKEKIKELNVLNIEIKKQKDILLKNSDKILKEIESSLKPIKDFDAKYKQLKGTVLFYYKRMETLEKEYTEQKEKINTKENDMKKELDDYRNSIKQEITKMEKTIEKYNILINEKNDIDKIFLKIRELREMKNKILTELILLNKKVDLVKIPRKRGDSVKVGREIKDIGEKIKLNKSEEGILKRKRQELRDLIKEMWEK